MTCVVCGKSVFERAHVRPRRTFEKGEDDRWKNIIRMCPTHHTIFDDGYIGICESKDAIIVKEEGDLYKTGPESPINHVKGEYIQYRNARCVREVKFRLGYIPGSEHGEWC